MRKSWIKLKSKLSFTIFLDDFPYCEKFQNASTQGRGTRETSDD